MTESEVKGVFSKSVRPLLPWAGALIGAAAMAWWLRGFSFDHFRKVFDVAHLRWLAGNPIASLIEQWVQIGGVD